jgi:aspartyl protease family protein
MERPQNNRFLEPKQGTGMVGWAMKQLAFWLVGGFVLYVLAVNHHLLGGDSSGPAQQTADARPPSGLFTTSEPDASAPDRKLVPLGQSTMVTNSLSLRAQSNGHVLLTAIVNNVPVRFMVDTGATWVSLTQQDAQRVGVAGNLDYSIPMNTANGIAKAAPVTLGGVRIGQLEVDQVEATVMSEKTGISLLGQSFLKRLQSYEMRGDTLTLTWQ